MTKKNNEYEIATKWSWHLTYLYISVYKLNLKENVSIGDKPQETRGVVAFYYCLIFVTRVNVYEMLWNVGVIQIKCIDKALKQIIKPGLFLYL